MIKPFGQATHRGNVSERVKHQFEINSFLETGCVLAEADNHMDCEFIYDRVTRKWAEIVFLTG